MNRRLFTFGAALALTMSAFAAAPIPRPAGEFVVQMVDGRKLLLSELKGKVVALEFMHTTCPHCQNCSVVMNKLYKEYGSRGFQPVGVAFNDMAALLVPDYVKSLQLQFPVGVATRDQVVAYLGYPDLQRMFVPQLMFINRKGMIVAYYPGGDDFFKNEEANMRAQIETLLKEPAGKPVKSARPAQKAKPASLSAAHQLK